MERSIAFGHEELAALAGSLGEQLPSIGPDPFADLPSSERHRLLEAGTRSLRARNVLTTGDDGSVQVALAAARLLEITCRPTVAITINRSDGAGWEAHPSRVACIPGASVATVWDDGVHRFTPFATENVLRRLATVAGIDHDLTPAAEPLSLDHHTLATALATALPAVRRDLFANGPDDLAGALVDDLAGAHAVAVRVAHRPVGGHQVGGEVAWLTGSAGTWELPASATPLGGPLRPTPGTTAVPLLPVSGSALLSAIAEMLEAPS